jgi:hypothetical protein
MMSVSRETYHIPQQPRVYTPTPDGFECRMRVWVAYPRTT